MTLFYGNDPLGIAVDIEREANSEINKLFGYTGGYSEYIEKNRQDLTRKKLFAMARLCKLAWPFHMSMIEEFGKKARRTDYAGVYTKRHI